jgi:nuclear GTP-binding protein
VLTDWNHQKIPYFSIPPAIHPSMIPSTIPNSGSTTSTETVGQVQILTKFSKPFELPGLFGAADGRFRRDMAAEGEGEEDAPMGDATPEGHEVEAEMLTDEMPVRIPVKRQFHGREAASGQYDRWVVRSSDPAFAAESPRRRGALKKDAKRVRRAATRVWRRSQDDMEVEADRLQNMVVPESRVSVGQSLLSGVYI